MLFRKSGSSIAGKLSIRQTKVMKAAKESGVNFDPEVLENSDTLKQLLARSWYLLYKNKSKWTASQVKRANLIFERYPLIQ